MIRFRQINFNLAFLSVAKRAVQNFPAVAGIFVHPIRMDHFQRYFQVSAIQKEIVNNIKINTIGRNTERKIACFIGRFSFKTYFTNIQYNTQYIIKSYHKINSVNIIFTSQVFSTNIHIIHTNEYHVETKTETILEAGHCSSTSLFLRIYESYRCLITFDCAPRIMEAPTHNIRLFVTKQ